ncbi:MAG TPA: universal stress protein [Bryobacteraceae bacterium]
MTQPLFSVQHILFPTDFSKTSEAAAAHTAGLARAVNAKVSLLNVVPWLPDWYGASEPYFPVGDDVLRNLELSKKAAEASCLSLLEGLQKQYFSGIPCDLQVRTGGVAKLIVEYAQEIQADLIMIPTRGAGPMRPFLIGSVTAKVLHDAPCAVWTSPHPRELEAFRPYRQIICAVDYRAFSRELLTKAWQVARLFQSRLSVVSAIPNRITASRAAGDHQSIQAQKTETYSALKNLLAELQVNASLHVLEGMTGEVIQRAAAMEDGDLVVIGHGRLDEPFGHLRTHAFEIIWNSPCPVLSL